MIQIDGNQTVGADFYLTNSDGEFSGFLSVEIDSDIEIAIDDNSERDEFKFYCVLLGFKFSVRILRKKGNSRARKIFASFEWYSHEVKFTKEMTSGISVYIKYNYFMC